MQAFEGVRVLDLTHVLAGPFATYQLAVMGADVIKIEAPLRHDMNREIGAEPDLDGLRMGTHFLSQGANKRAVTLDLKADEGREIFLRLAATADVIVENFRTGAMDRLGLGHDAVRAVRPEIIYCSLTGFGATGPKAGHAAFDNVIQAWSGMMAATGPSGGPPVPIGPPVLDYGTGAQAAFAIAAALFRRERTGQGQRIDIAMLDAALMLMACFVTNHSTTGAVPGPTGDGRNFIAGYGWYETARGKLALGVCTPDQHARLWQALGRPDLAEQAAPQTLADMQANRGRDEAILSEILATRSADDWEGLLNEAGLPAARARTLDEALASEQVATRDVLGRFGDPRGGGERLAAVAAFRARPDGACIRSAPPRHGQHTDTVLAELGYDAEAIGRLRAQGVLA